MFYRTKYMIKRSIELIKYAFFVVFLGLSTLSALILIIVFINILRGSND